MEIQLKSRLNKLFEQKKRCAWCTDNPVYIAYHDNEWGIPVFDDQILFEFLTLEGAQAGLSWITILKRRESYRLAFDSFEVKKIAQYKQKKINELFENDGIIRNKLKIASVIKNAQAFLKIQDEFGSFSNYQWRFVAGIPKKNTFKKIQDIPASTEASHALSKDLKKRGFSFVGPTIIYAYMQAVGMVNDHTTDCFLFN